MRPPTIGPVTNETPSVRPTRAPTRPQITMNMPMKSVVVMSESERPVESRTERSRSGKVMNHWMYLTYCTQ